MALAALVAFVGAAVVPTGALAQTGRSYGQDSTWPAAGQAPSGEQVLTVNHFASIALWGVIGAAAAAAFVETGLTVGVEPVVWSLFGAVVGAFIGDWWYGARLWPFERPAVPR